MTPSDADLVNAARLGDRDAFGILVDRHRARAAGLAAAILGDLAEAEDVTQEALYQAYFGIDRLRDPSRFGEWLCGIAINLAKMALRRRRVTVSLEDLDGGRVPHGFRLEDTTPESEFEARELRTAVRRAIGQLPEDLRAAVWLHYAEGLSYREIGALFGVTPGALRVQAHRARSQLRKALLGEWGKQTRREEVTMIEVTVQDVLVWLPEDWQPKPIEAGKLQPEQPPGKMWVVLLKERDGDRALPIWIGHYEGEALAWHLAEIQPVRPLTFNFFARLLDAVSVTVERVAVSEIRGDTYIATVTVRSGQQAHEVDARPSDALNLALRAGVPIFVAPEVMSAHNIPIAQAHDEITQTTVRLGRTPEAGYAWRSGREMALAQKSASSPKPC